MRLKVPLKVDVAAGPNWLDTESIDVPPRPAADQPDPNRGIVLGLVGPVCAGKSEVTRLLQQRGAAVYLADAVVRELYEKPDVKEAVRQLFGEDVFDVAENVNRAAIAARIFGPQGDAELRRRLTEEVIFPRTGQVLRTEIDEFRQRAASQDVFVVDAPTLIEAGRTDWCDRILLVSAPLARRQQWAAGRGWTEGELEQRDAAMIPEPEKRRRADFVIDNGGTLAELASAVDRLWTELRSKTN